jgi:hypothetical protein
MFNVCMAFSFKGIECTEVKKKLFISLKTNKKTPRQSLTGAGRRLNWVGVGCFDGRRSGNSLRNERQLQCSYMGVLL